MGSGFSGARRESLCRVLFEEIDHLGLAVFEHLEVRRAEARYWLVSAFGDHHVDNHVAGVGPEYRSRIRVGGGLGKESDSGSSDKHEEGTTEQTHKHLAKLPT